MTVTTNSCFVPANNAEEIMVIVRELRNRGLAQGHDFDFRWQPRYEVGYIKLQSGAEFTFRDAKWATMFRIKYGSMS